MGMRTVFSFETEPNEYIHLYSHWGGDVKLEELVDAIEKAAPRWDDETYALRIMISQLIGNNWDGELGFGLWTQNIFEEEYTPVIVHIREKAVTMNGQKTSYGEFAEDVRNGILARDLPEEDRV